MKLLFKLVFILSCMAYSAGSAQAGTTCPLVLAGALPVTYIDGRMPVITVRIGGKELSMMVDSGSGLSAITVASWQALGGPPFRDLRGSYGIGVGGVVQLNTGLLEDVDTGHAIAKDQAFMVSDLSVMTLRGKKLADGVLGYDFLDNFDIAFDLPDNRISLYFIQHCDSPVAPWAGDFDAETLNINRTSLNETIPYEIDDQRLQGMIDSGAYSTLVSQAALDHAGLKPVASLNLAKTGFGVGNLPFSYQIEQFASAAIGAEQFGDVWLRVGGRSLADLADVIVGEDYLWTHRVFISNSTQTALLGLYVPPHN